MPPKPAISRELVQNLINSAAAAPPSSHNYHWRPGAITLAPPKKFISGAKSLESLLLDSDPPPPPPPWSSHLTSVISSDGTATADAPAATAATFSWTRRTRPLSGGYDDRLASSSVRGSNFTGAGELKVNNNNNNNCDNDNDQLIYVTPDLVIEQVHRPVVVTAAAPPGYWRSRSLHQLPHHPPHPSISPEFHTDRSDGELKHLLSTSTALYDHVFRPAFHRFLITL